MPKHNEVTQQLDGPQATSSNGALLRLVRLLARQAVRDTLRPEATTSAAEANESEL